MHLTQLPTHRKTIALLQSNGIHSIEQLGRMPVQDVRRLNGMSDRRCDLLLRDYAEWFEQNVCGKVPVLPKKWKPF